MVSFDILLISSNYFIAFITDCTLGTIYFLIAINKMQDYITSSIYRVLATQIKTA